MTSLRRLVWHHAAAAGQYDHLLHQSKLLKALTNSAPSTAALPARDITCAHQGSFIMALGATGTHPLPR